MTYTIKDLAQGKCAVLNDGTLEELREVLSAAQGEKCSSIYGIYDVKYYWTDMVYHWYNDNVNARDLPVQSVKEFHK